MNIAKPLKIYALLALLGTAGVVFGQTTFYKSYGGGYYDAGFGLTFNNDSGYIVVGQTGNNNNYGDALIFSTDSLGAVNWWKSYGGNLEDILKDVVRNSNGNYYGVGFTRSFGAGGYDGWLVKFNNQGDTIFTKTFGGTDWDFFRSITINSLGNLAIVGHSFSNAIGENDAWALGLDTLGNILWQHKLGGDKKDVFNHVLSMPFGMVCATGTTFKTDSVNGNAYGCLIDSAGNIFNQFELGDSNYVEKGAAASNYFWTVDSSITFITYDNETADGLTGYSAYVIDYFGSVYYKAIDGDLHYNLSNNEKFGIVNINNSRAYMLACPYKNQALTYFESLILLTQQGGFFKANALINQPFHQKPQELLVFGDTATVVLVNLEGVGPGTNSIGLLRVDKNFQHGGFTVNIKKIKKEKVELSVFPNPVSNHLNISTQATIKKVVLYNANAKRLQTIKPNSNNAIINLSPLQSGLYFVKIYTNQGVTVRKIVKSN